AAQESRAWRRSAPAAKAAPHPIGSGAAFVRLRVRLPVEPVFRVVPPPSPPSPTPPPRGRPARVDAGRTCDVC
ncbi:hypothetical protein ACWF82_32830, partial [Nocardia sp. NPDC055053]